MLDQGKIEGKGAAGPIGVIGEGEGAAQALGEALTEIRLNRLASPEANDLLQRSVIEPLQALQAGDMERQRQALEDLARNLDNDLLSEAQRRQDALVERMKDILRQMGQWDSFIDVLNQLNEIIRLQSQVKQQTSRLKASEVEGVFDP